MTRRAKHQQNGIIETSLSGPHGKHTPRAFSFRLQESDGAPRIAASPSLKRVHGAPIGAPPSEALYWPSTRERAGPRREPLLAPPRSPQDGDKVRAETIARRLAICRIVVFVGEKMTLYLISLALAGLIAIVVWEIFA